MPHIIDKIGISKATNLAAQQSIPQHLSVKKTFLMVILKLILIIVL